jgi:hypothetical protein
MKEMPSADSSGPSAKSFWYAASTMTFSSPALQR